MYDVDDGDERPIRGSRVIVGLYVLGWGAAMWGAGHPYMALFAGGLCVGLAWARRAALVALCAVMVGCGAADAHSGPGDCVSPPGSTCAEATYGTSNVCGAQPKSGFVVCCCWTDSGATETSERPLDAGPTPLVIACTDRGDADIPTAMVEASGAESACLAAHCTPNVQCGDPGRTTCVEPHDVHGLTGIWSCPLGCCY